MFETDPDELDQDDPHAAEDDGPDVEELEQDPAYNPDDDDLESLKGG